MQVQDLALGYSTAVLNGECIGDALSVIERLCLAGGQRLADG